jgi:prepilin-type N-terminal cleavage/methylation domain-containing protein/prepilin-type processing-associated H-X9-DG protein
MPVAHDRRRGFSLLELLIVIGIIALLIAILLPVVSSVRKASRSTKCLANLQQWGQSFQMYLNANKGQSIPMLTGGDPKHLEWFEALAPYHGNVRETLVCPEAIEARAHAAALNIERAAHLDIKGAAHLAWLANHNERGDFLGSFGVNIWIYAIIPFQRPNPEIFRFPVKEPDRIPLLADCADFRIRGRDGDAVPPDLENPVSIKNTATLSDCCINRHNMAVNVVFVDGHAEHVQLADLWKLKWSQTFHARDVTVPAP